jgi:hypothetical protein
MIAAVLQVDQVVALQLEQFPPGILSRLLR